MVRRSHRKETLVPGYFFEEKVPGVCIEFQEHVVEQDDRFIMNFRCLLEDAELQCQCEEPGLSLGRKSPARLSQPSDLKIIPVGSGQRSFFNFLELLHFLYRSLK